MASGLRLASSRTGPIVFAGTASLALAGIAALVAHRPSAARPAGGRVALAAGLALATAGLGLGVRAGARADASCAASLRTGDGVVVEGILVSDLRAPTRGGEDGAGRWARASLLDATVGHAGRSCRLPRLPIRVLRPSTDRSAGARVRAVGEWRRYGSLGERMPRAPDRYGAVYGTLAPDGGTLGLRAAGRAGRPLGPFAAARARASRRLGRLLPADAVPAARALVLADRSDLPPAEARRFADAGLAHLLAISGLHVGLLAAGVLWLAGIALGRRARWTAAAVATLAYVAWIGAPPAAVRASLAFAGLACARARGSPARLGDLLGWAGAASLVGSPLLLVHPGFQLSFAGVLGLWAGDRLGARVTTRTRATRGRRAGRTVRWAARLLRALGASAGAFLFTAPLAAAHFGRIAPASVVSSLLGGPLVALALAGLLPALLLPDPAASLLAAAAVVPLRALGRLAETFARLPLHGAASPPDGLAWTALVVAVAGLAAVTGRTRSGRARGALALAAAAALWIAAPGLRGGPGRGNTLLCTLDVGQGDAAVLRTRRGHWIAFDAGPGPGPAARDPGSSGSRSAFASYDAGGRVLVPFLRARGARAVDLFVLSHPHLDHLGGTGALFRSFPVRRVLDAGLPLPSAAYLRYLAEVEEIGARWLTARPGARLRLDEVELLVLGPEPTGARSGDPVLDPNEASLAVRVRIAESFVYLNTGDASAEAEAEMLARWPADSLRAQVLKLGHHGSRTSSSIAWLEATRPVLAVISVGARNRYGHPHASALARLDSAGVPAPWRTDRRGTLCVEVEEGGGWTVRPG